jgi:hypothetical protein
MSCTDISGGDIDCNTGHYLKRESTRPFTGYSQLNSFCKRKSRYPPQSRSSNAAMNPFEDLEPENAHRARYKTECKFQWTERTETEEIPESRYNEHKSQED